MLPIGYAPLMGYTGADVVSAQATQVGGSVNTMQATKPCSAVIPEIPDVVFDLNPCFIQGCQTALWGRKDLLRHFDMSISELRQQFTLTSV